MGNGKGSKSKRQPVNEVASTPLAKGGTAVLEAERERVEKVFRKAEQEKATILNSLSEIVIFQDLEHRMIWANKAAAKSVGLPSEKLVGRYCYDVWGSGGEPCPGCPVEEACKAGKPQTGEMATPDGRVWSVRGYPVRDANGDIASMVEVVLEITERKQAEEELQEEKSKLESVIGAMEDGLNIMDKDYNIIYQSELPRELYGDHLGEKCYRVYTGSEEVCDGCPVEKAFKDGKSHTSERALVLPSGELVYWETLANPVRDAGGNIISCLEIARNITERKQTEDALQAEKNKLESVIDAMDYTLTIQDKDFNIIYQNESSKLASGGDHIGEKCYRVYEGRDEICDGCPVKKAFKDGKSHTAERQSIGPSGEVVFWENTASPIRDAQGEIVSCLELTRDITEHKKAEQMMADEATRHRILIDQSSDGIVIMDESGGVYKANLRFAEMLGYTYEEAQKLSVWDWEYLFPREQVAEMIANIGPEGDHFETKHRRKDGTTFDVEISTNGAVCSGQKLIFCVCRDITERKQAEQALAEAEKKYKNLVEVASDLIWEVDTQGRYTFISPKIKDILGYEVDEVVGKKRTLDFTPKEEVRKWLKRFKEINAKREGFSSFEVLHLHKNGTPVFFEVSGIPYFDSAGDFKGYVGINKDVTERKQMTKALRESQEFSNGLLENSPNPIFVLNPDTSVRYVNPAFENLTGFKLDSIVGKKAPYPWWLKEESKATTLGLKNAMVSGGKRSEKIFQKKDGERFCVALNSAPVVYRKKLLYFLISWLDITDRKRAEEEKVELEQKAHLASRLASVGEMASGIAHEINNPLTAVIGFAQLLMDTDLPEEIKEDLIIIHKEAQRAAGVARNLLTFARKHAPSKQPIGVNSIIEGVLALRAYEQNVSNIQINTKLAPDLPEVMADYSQLQQVFINLILNSEAAMLEANNGGTLTITTQKFNHSVRALFADDGPGIDKENLNRIFDPFFTTKEVGKGTGLGLSVCHGIVAEHGGRIYARSKPGSGATFVVELPINSHEQLEKPNEAAKEPKQKNPGS
jgi:PAS domain S-box-containing protein